MTAATLPNLRPLRVGEILDRGIRLYRRRFLTFVGIIALVQIPLVLIQSVAALLTVNSTYTTLEEMFANPTAPPENPLTMLGPAYAAGASLNTLVSVLSFFLVQGIATAALTKVVAAGYLGRPPTGILEAYRDSRDVWVSLILALVMAVLLAIGLGLWWIFVPCLGWITGGGALLYLFAVIIPLLAPVVVLERPSPTVAWRRVWNLARRRFWWLLGFAGILYLFNLLIVAGPSAVVGGIGQFVIGDPFAPDANSLVLQTAVQSLITLVGSLFYLPLQITVMTVLYFDLRVRMEGLDLALQIQESDNSTPEPSIRRSSTPPHQITPLAAVASSAPLVKEERLVTATELSYFGAISVGLILLVLLLYAVLFALIFALASAFG